MAATNRAPDKAMTVGTRVMVETIIIIRVAPATSDHLRLGAVARVRITREIRAAGVLNPVMTGDSIRDRSVKIKTISTQETISDIETGDRETATVGIRIMVDNLEVIPIKAIREIKMMKTGIEVGSVMHSVL